MVLSEYALTHPGFRFRILATESPPPCWQRPSWEFTACDAVRPVPRSLQRKVLHARPRAESELVRVVPELRRLVEFRRLNFMDADYGMAEKADVIFCRNVIIYFDRPTQEKILQKLTRHLLPAAICSWATRRRCTKWICRWCAVAPALYRRADVRD